MRRDTYVPSTQQIESHDAHILSDRRERSVMMQLSGFTWQTSAVSMNTGERSCLCSSAYFKCGIKSSCGWCNQIWSFVRERARAGCGFSSVLFYCFGKDGVICGWNNFPVESIEQLWFWFWNPLTGGAGSPEPQWLIAQRVVCWNQGKKYYVS